MLSRICSRSRFSPASPEPWLFVGLGNPGDKYKGTRHNVGFEMVDAFAESLGIPMGDLHCKAIFGRGFFLPSFGLATLFPLSPCKKRSIHVYVCALAGIDFSKLLFSGLVKGVPVFLAKPQTYMNLSGESSGPLGAYYKLPLNRVIVFHDDMNLPCGVLRLDPKGGHHSHNGLKSVIYHFRGNREFPRLRIGIGRPAGQMDPKVFLLQKFNATARERIDVALNEGVDALKQLVSEGLMETARWFNSQQKYKHIRSRAVPE